MAAVLRAVESVKKEKWGHFRGRHGDWGRDAAFYIARKDGGIALCELAKIAGLGTTAVSMAIRRIAASLDCNETLASSVKQCRKELKSE